MHALRCAEAHNMYHKICDIVGGYDLQLFSSGKPIDNNEHTTYPIAASWCLCYHNATMAFFVEICLPYVYICCLCELQRAPVENTLKGNANWIYLPLFCSL